MKLEEEVQQLVEANSALNKDGQRLRQERQEKQERAEALFVELVKLQQNSVPLADYEELQRNSVPLADFEDTKKARLLMGKVAGGLGGLAGLTLGSGITYLATRGKKRPSDSAQAAKKRKRASAAGKKRPRKTKAKPRK
jgi:hypothetical protein